MFAIGWFTKHWSFVCLVCKHHWFARLPVAYCPVCRMLSLAKSKEPLKVCWHAGHA